MATVFDVAEFFLSKSDDDSEQFMSNLKLQKLVYYAQGFSLALLGRRLFSEPIEAWQHGPVVPELYRKYRDCGSSAIPAAEYNRQAFRRDELSLLEEVYEVYGQYSAWKLRELTHSEDPWVDNYAEGSYSREIPLQEIEEYFAEHLVN